MLTEAIFVLCLLVAPPPTKPPTKTTFGGGGDWVLTNVSPQEAALTLAEFSQSYIEADATADFPLNPLRFTRAPQGILALKQNENIRLLCHFVENAPGIATITSIAAPLHELEAGKKLCHMVRDSENLRLQLSQKKWMLAYRFYNGML